MPDLIYSLQGRDLSHLRMVAELWGVDLKAPDARSGRQELVKNLLDPILVEENIDLLPDEARSVLDELLRHDGRMPWSLITRRFGEVREMGPARRDREKPHLHPKSAIEALWYRALVARAFFDTSSGPQEFIYIPDDFLKLLPASQGQVHASLGRPASQMERNHPIQANDLILDQACTLLAGLRLGLSLQEIWAAENQWGTASPQRLKAILESADLLDADGLPQIEPVREFLEAPRADALLKLVRSWLSSNSFNELFLVPGLLFEGEWQNDPLRTRQRMLAFLSSVPDDTWWSLPAFIADIRQTYPDFQRPAGDYDSWYIRDTQSGEFLRGFAHWDEVDGALIRFFIAGPLHWLGFVDLGMPGADLALDIGNVTAFRITSWTKNFLAGLKPDGVPSEEEFFQAGSNARLHIPRLVSRSVRYQLARFGQWEAPDGETYLYQLTPASLERARQQGLLVKHLLALLRRYTSSVPPNLVRALERWEKSGSQAKLERVTVLRLSNPEIMEKLRKTRAARFLGDPLGPTTVIVNPGAWKKVLAALAEMGYLGEVRGNLD
jgi:hypothetical protein